MLGLKLNHVSKRGPWRQQLPGDGQDCFRCCWLHVSASHLLEAWWYHKPWHHNYVGYWLKSPSKMYFKSLQYLQVQWINFLCWSVNIPGRCDKQNSSLIANSHGMHGFRSYVIKSMLVGYYFDREWHHQYAKPGSLMLFVFYVKQINILLKFCKVCNSFGLPNIV